jgi:DNA-binding NtrC family response regulator
MPFCASVLIVDDDPALLVALSDMLTYRLPDVRVTTRESAITGLEAVRNTNYRVMIADLRMPEMDGLTLLRHVHQVREHTRVVIMSGVTEWGLMKRVVEAGAFAFIQKPFERGPLAQIVRLAIQCSQMRERVLAGTNRLARMTEILRKVESRPSSAALQHAFIRMTEGTDRGKISIVKLKQVILGATQTLHQYNGTLQSLEDEGRTRAKRMLETLGE